MISRSTLVDDIEATLVGDVGGDGVRNREGDVNSVRILLDFGVACDDVEERLPRIAQPSVGIWTGDFDILSYIRRSMSILRYVQSAHNNANNNMIVYNTIHRDFNLPVCCNRLRQCIM